MPPTRRQWLQGCAALAAGCALPRRPGPALSSTHDSVHLRVHSPYERTQRGPASFAVPFAPGQLHALTDLRLEDARGQALPFAASVLEPWRRVRPTSGPPSIRAARLTLTASFDPGVELPLRVVLGPGLGTTTLTTMAPGPLAVAQLPAAWLCRSEVAGPLRPEAVTPSRLQSYDALIRRNFAGAIRTLQSGDAQHWLYDRTTVLYRQYVRSGEPAFLEAALAAGAYMRTHTVTEGPATGSFDRKPDDIKYVYAQGMHLHYLLTGDARAQAAGLAMARYCLQQWSPSPGAGFWSTRSNAYAFLGALHGWELSGESTFWQRCLEHIEALYTHQRGPHDGHPPDGSWRQDWSRYDAEESTVAAGTSAWMVAIMLEPMFQHWRHTGDARIPEMITRWCEFLDGRGFHPSGLPYYIIDSLGTQHALGPDAGDSIDHMAQHSVELAYTFAMGLHFEKRPAMRARFQRRFDDMFAWTDTNLNLTSPPRAYNWAFAASAQISWLLGAE